MSIITIPIKDSTEDEVIEIDCENLPAGEELLAILRQERAALHYWIDVAVQYHRHGLHAEFIKILESSGGEASLDYGEVERDQMRALDTLAAFYVQEGHKERMDKEKRKEFYQKATLLYTTADKIRMYEQTHLLGRAYFCLLEGPSKIDQADQQFQFVMNADKDNIPAILGRAVVYFQKKEYKNALFHFKKALKMKPDCPADVRLGIGHCLVRMGKLERARLAFERCLELDPTNMNATVALAIMDHNTQTAEGVHRAITALTRAFGMEPHNPIALNHLANHFFFKQQDMSRVIQFAVNAMHTGDVEPIRAEGAYHIARCYHKQKDYEKAFRYYYQSTQFASPAFVLPYFGLGQMYIHRQEFANAINCFEKILKIFPNNAETLKMVGSLYAHIEVDNPKELAERKQKAREMLTKLLAQWPDDVEALIDLAQLTEFTDPQKSLQHYEHAARLLTEREQVDIPPEMTNNIGSLHLNMGNYEKARQLFGEALVKLQEDVALGQAEPSLELTIRYNLARALEMLCLYEDAEKLYKAILRQNQNYIDCYMRLGCLARDRGHFYDASVWFKEGMSINQQHADAWTLIGNLHMSKAEWGPAQKKFEQILKAPDRKDDAYSTIGLGNVWLETLFSHNRNKDKDKVHVDRAIHYFSKALKMQPKNMWAANGIACALAFKGLFAEARDIFSQVREATADFCDVWINIAHVYMEQKQYVPAVQMYSSAMKRFNKELDVTMLSYLARAYYKAGKLTDCRNTLEKAASEQPDNLLVKFNYAFILQKQATQHLRDDKATLEFVTGAVEDLKTAERVFSWLSGNRDDTLSQARMVSKTVAGDQARQCSDLLCQAQLYVQRARTQDEADQQQRRKQDEEREALRHRFLEEQRVREEQRRRQAEEQMEQRKMYVQMTKDLLKMPELPPEEKKSRGGGGGGRKKKRGEEGEEFVNDSSDMGYSAGEGGAEGGERKKKSGSRKKRERRGRSGSGSEDEADKEERRRRRKEAQASKAEVKLSSKQSAKVKSRAFLSSEEDSSDGGPPPAPVLSGDESPPPPAFDDSDDSVESDPEPSRLKKKKKAVLSDASDSEGSNKSGPIIGASGSEAGSPAHRSGTDSD